MIFILFFQVYFVDFGNCECIKVKDLITDPHFEDVPAQCLKIMLAGIEPLDKVINGNAA